MSNQSLAEQLKNDIRSLQSDLNGLEDGVRMSDIRDRVEDLESSVYGMDRQIESLRSRGYAFEKSLEAKAVEFAEEWRGIAPNIKNQIARIQIL